MYSSKYHGFLSVMRSLRHESIRDEMSENQRMKEALQKIADLCESVWEIETGKTMTYS